MLPANHLATRTSTTLADYSVETKVFKRGMDAYNNPRFYRQLGKEPEQITQDALETLADRFGLPISITTLEKWSAI